MPTQLQWSSDDAAATADCAGADFSEPNESVLVEFAAAFVAEQSGDEDHHAANDHSGCQTEAIDRENGAVERHE